MELIVNTKNTLLTLQPGNQKELQQFEELRETFTFPVPGAYFTPAYKQNRWDGKKRFIDAKGKFLTGLLPFVIDCLKEMGVEKVPFRLEVPPIPATPEMITTHNGITLRKDQEVVLKAIREKSRGIIDCATNMGKSYLMLFVYLNYGCPKTLITVHSKLIFDQLVELFTNVFGANMVGQVGGKTEQVKHITIAMKKTILNRSDDDFMYKAYLMQVKLLMVDECHLIKGDEYMKLLDKINCMNRYFFSGTPIKGMSAVNKMTVIGMSGRIISKVSNAQLIDAGISLRPQIKVYLNDHTPNYFDYTSEYEQLVKFSPVRKRVLDDIVAANPDKQILVAVEKIDHADFLADGKYEMTHGGDKDKKKKIEDFKAGRIKVLICTMIIKEGVNIPNIQILMLAQAGKSPITVLQLIGRALRKNENETSVDIIDFWDLGRNTEKHSRARVRMYKKEGFNVEFMYANKAGKPVDKK